MQKNAGQCSAMLLSAVILWLRPFRCFEEPSTASNVQVTSCNPVAFRSVCIHQAVNQLIEMTLTPVGAGAVEPEEGKHFCHDKGPVK